MSPHGGGCACGSAHAGCVPSARRGACVWWARVRASTCSRQPAAAGRTFDTRSTRIPNGIPQKFLPGLPRSESRTTRPTPIPRYQRCKPLRRFQTFEISRRQLTNSYQNFRRSGKREGRTDGRNSFPIGDHPAASHCLHLDKAYGRPIAPPGRASLALSSPLRASTLGGR